MGSKSTTPLLDILSPHLPTRFSSALSQLIVSSESRSLLETLLSFAVGGECSTHASRDVRQEWTRNQPAAIKALQEFVGSKGSKRGRESEDTEESSSKRPRTSETEADDDPPLFTLPSISVTSPIRKKVNITIHERSIRFINTGSRAVESSIPLSSISRAFLLPTRGKAKGHWTVVLLPSDVPEKGKTSASSPQQIIFGLDALSTTKFETTSYTSGSSSPKTTAVAKGEETLASIRSLLSYLPVPLLEPSATVFRSACATAKSGHGAAGVDAYLSAKSGTLWFFDTGILWGESKPCEFWAVSDLLAKDGIRLISATGRTCSVILGRKNSTSKDADKQDDDEAEDEGEEVVETEFAMVDGREQDPINAWARQRKHVFGKEVASSSDASPTKEGRKGTAGTGAAKGQLPTTAAKGPAWDDSDSDDEDYEIASSEDLEGSSGSDSDDSEDGGGSGDEGEGDEGEGEGSGSEVVEQSGDDESEEELQEAHHPLLRPGAMPRMSKAAIDAVVDMVNGDMMDAGSDEEDELDD
ncbi:hypothetical protein HYDPIDRAFT_112325 [Hydnomerulius pinastri MD-312]|uniref:Histone chaperone RTT106/FACT complex subunit SPT16-like middle domain-containing protein n=1 Tax=Hydnomerulius pinastri MD-312 TaxID=994086 RepID=A0A0C9WEY1_9AGAM|nr:hypothetical protein HYDPIDRAFT_112325 [Hydnomerulius pinastri MD-312]